MTLAQPTPSVGSLLRSWRVARGKSQLDLSLDAGVSSRHLSFVETGRASPSRDMVLTLAEALEVPLRDRNVLLQAAGFAAVYRETPLEAPALEHVRDALAQLLRASEPNPALVLNRRYDIVMASAGATALLAFFAPAFMASGRKPNLARLLLDRDGLRGSLQNWREVTSHVIHRMQHGLASSHARDADDEALLRDAAAAEPELRAPHGAQGAPSLLVPARLRRGDVSVELFTVIATLGTPLDITLQELRIETLFPANAESKAALETLAREHGAQARRS